MTCESCRLAETEPTRYGFENGCRSCSARALAAIGAHTESLERKALTADYRSALEKLFGEQWRDGHELVKVWGGRIRSMAASQQARAA